MVLFPNCKINLGLHIIGKRTDGFHDLESVFYPVPLRDILEVIETPNASGPGVKFSFSGIPVGDDPGNNLCVRAYHLLKKDFPGLPSVLMHLHKTIPIGAGLGGGSADGSFTLILLNKKFGLNLTEKKLIDYSLQLGSDCPFFIMNKPCLAGGRGEIMEEINLHLINYKIILVYPTIHISTAWAFSSLDICKQTRPIRTIITQPVESWKHELKNDFETPVFNKYPEIKKIKDELYNAGAVYASMSGSGSAVYGIFEKGTTIELNIDKSYFTKEIEQ